MHLHAWAHSFRHLDRESCVLLFLHRSNRAATANFSCISLARSICLLWRICCWLCCALPASSERVPGEYHEASGWHVFWNCQAKLLTIWCGAF